MCILYRQFYLFRTWKTWWWWVWEHCLKSTISLFALYDWCLCGESRAPLLLMLDLSWTCHGGLQWEMQTTPCDGTSAGTGARAAEAELTNVCRLSQAIHSGYVLCVSFWIQVWRISIFPLLQHNFSFFFLYFRTRTCHKNDPEFGSSITRKLFGCNK